MSTENDGVGTFDVTIALAHPAAATDWGELEARVDTGATLSFVPGDVLRALGIQSTSTRPFRLADGSVIERPVGDARIRYEAGSVLDVVVFAAPNEPILLGARTLEGVFLAVDPVNKRLVPIAGDLL